MKTLLKTALTLAFTAIVLSASSFSSSAALSGRKLEMSLSNPEIKKVIVTGNVKVYLVQSKTEWVNYDESQADKIIVKQIGNTLTLGSTTNELVTMTVYVKDLYRIDASNTAEVRTVGCFKLKNLQVLLKDNARARVKANTESLYTVINSNANLELLGTTDNHILKSYGSATLNTEKFAALKTEHVAADETIALNANASDSTSRKIMLIKRAN